MYDTRHVAWRQLFAAAAGAAMGYGLFAPVDRWTLPALLVGAVLWIVLLESMHLGRPR